MTVSEVYEVVDRTTGRRVMEVVFLTANDALAALEQWSSRSPRKYRAQSVKVANRP